MVLVNLHIIIAILFDTESTAGLFRGSGHTKSHASIGTNSWILSYKYHCLCKDKPSGVTTRGRSDGNGCHNISLRSLIFFSVVIPFSVVSHDLRTYTVPGCVDVNLKWEYDFIPFSADLMTRSSEKVLQSYVSTISYIATLIPH